VLVELDDVRRWDYRVFVEEDALGALRVRAVGFGEYDDCGGFIALVDRLHGGIERGPYWVISSGWCSALLRPRGLL
jgi:hypothetical protein